MSRVNVAVETRSTSMLTTHRTETEAFSLIICLDVTKFVLVSVLILVENICQKLWAKLRPKNKKGPLPADACR